LSPEPQIWVFSQRFNGMRSSLTGRRARLARRLLGSLETWELVTWECRSPGARVLMMTNVWPHPPRPAYGPFVKYTYDAITDHGVPCDVLFVRGYCGWRAYLAGAIAAAVVPLAYPGRYLLVHSHGGETALVARCFWGLPVLASYLGTDLLGSRIGGGRGTRLKCSLRSLVLRWHAALMSATTTKSAEMQAVLARPARSHNTVIPDGVDRERFRPGDRDRACRELGWDPAELHVLFAGRADAVEKRFWLAEQTVALARRELPGVTLRVASGIPPSEMPSLYVAADCLLHTSASEGSSNVIKEALACDLPVIATPCGDTHELLAGVALCRLCRADPAALADALVEILRTRRRSDGRTHTEHLGKEAIAERTLELYRALIAGRGGDPRSLRSDPQDAHSASMVGAADHA
jgi:teichuronic acid biosynthesis glycosyltransferase TuaC